MHRWFYAADEILCIPAIEPPRPPTPPPPEPPTPPELPPDILWKFVVKFKGKLCYNELIAVSGNTDSLGNWKVEDSVFLEKDKDICGLWTVELMVPRSITVRYRYLICAKHGLDQKIIRFWETSRESRSIKVDATQDWDNIIPEIFGLRKRNKKIQRGWLMPDTNVLQFKFFKAPFLLKDMSVCPLIYVKICALKVGSYDRCKPLEPPEVINEEVELKHNYAFIEVATLHDQKEKFHYQPKFGTPCGPQDLVLFHLTLGDMDTTAYLINLYSYPAKAGEDIPPYHLGYQYIYPQQIRMSSGQLRLHIMCATKHITIGIMTCQYLVIRHLDGHQFNAKDSFKMIGHHTREKVVDIGHRGCGYSFWHKNNILRENSIKSFSLAFEHGADMVEFDVQLTSDKIPIIHHDMVFLISRSTNIDPEEHDILKIPLYKEEILQLKPFCRQLKSGLIGLPLSYFTLEQLQRVQVDQSPKAARAQPCVEDPKLNLPFVTLENLFKKMPLKLAFNIEIKYSQQFSNQKWEENFPTEFDKNEYVDIILDIVFKYAGSRVILFSTFDADICTMVRLKQNRYPIGFLCISSTDELKYLDPRSDTLLQSTLFASAMELNGIVADAQDVLKNPERVTFLHDQRMGMFAWGSCLREEKCRKDLRKLQVNGIIFDRINKDLEPKNLGHNILLIELKSPTDDEEKVVGEGTEIQTKCVDYTDTDI